MKIQKTSAILAGIVNLLATTCIVGGSTTTIDPPRGAVFKDPVTIANISKIPGIVEAASPRCCTPNFRVLRNFS